MDNCLITTCSAGETETLGGALAALLPPGTVVALFGELASGKTCFVRGMATYLAGEELVHSPTFTLVNEYGSPPKLFHVDLYRLSSLEELADLGYEELFDSDAICAVEWAERAQALLPQRRIDVTFQHAGHDRRRIQIQNTGILLEGWQSRLPDR